MAVPTNQVRIKQKTYYRLSRLKKEFGADSFDSLINELIRIKVRDKNKKNRTRNKEVLLFDL